MDYANFNLGANNNILDFQEVLMKKKYEKQFYLYLILW